MIMKNRKMTTKEFIVSLLYDFVGCTMLSFAIKCFLAPNHIAPGGVSGISTLINYLTALPIGTTSLALNVPLLLIAYKHLGKSFTLKTMQTTIMFTFTMDVFLMVCPVYQGDPMLASLFGGVFSGIGSGIIFMRGSTSGGADIITKLIQKKRPYIPIGTLVLIINAVIIISAALVYQNIEAALYGLIVSFTTGKIMDAMIYGADTGKSCMIVTHKPKEMGDGIIKRINRSATILQGTGAYNKEDTWMLMCVVRKQEFFNLKAVIREIDPNAFIIVSEAHQIIGQGFKAMDSADT